MEHDRYPKVKDTVKYDSELVLMRDHEVSMKSAL